MQIAGYAKHAVTNGYPGVYGFLGQYFDKAYKMDENGNITTNQTGVLSPYGEFFPTEPGQAALVTMPDIDTSARGTGVVNVVKLQLDVNHDGIMDTSFAGPDNTSAANPFVFWANNNYDRLHNVDCGFTTCDSDQDDLKSAGAPGGYGSIVPDYMYRNIVPFVGIVPSIPCEKDFGGLRPALDARLVERHICNAGQLYGEADPHGRRGDPAVPCR